MAFLSKIQQAGRNNVDILIVPASDWKEMTLLAAKTAIVRGVENGSNIIRHTNNGMSIVSNVKGCVLAQTDSERFVKDIMKDIKKCPKIKHFQALLQYTYSVIFHALHIIFYQTDNFVVHAFPALSAVME